MNIVGHLSCFFACSLKRWKVPVEASAETTAVELARVRMVAERNVSRNLAGAMRQKMLCNRRGARAVESSPFYPAQPKRVRFLARDPGPVALRSSRGDAYHRRFCRGVARGPPPP